VILLKFPELDRPFNTRSYSVTLLTMNFIPFTLINVVTSVVTVTVITC